ncbi:hypothetical protein [Agromyces sp. Marseille-Q5079]|uniref:hypothetical protein n=1 Tax=Agromyces sp. Marseille-Q5079 TaxID=3439059 RepID=UPI003D9CAAD5
MSTNTDGTRLGRSDRVGLYVTIVLGLIGIAVAAWTMLARLVEVLPGTDVPVRVPFVGETADLPIGPDGAPIEVAVDEATVIVPHPAAATQFAIVAEPIVYGLAIIAGITLLGLLCWNLARGRAFTRSTVRIIGWGGGTLAIGWVVGSLFTTMSVNGALSAISDYQYEGITFGTNFGAMFGILAIAAIGAAFQVGERLQRDSEGLV